jgi:hypothetical protein
MTAIDRGGANARASYRATGYGIGPCELSEARGGEQFCYAIAPISPWTTSTTKDDMTDVVSHTLVTKAKAGNGTLTISCGQDGDERLFIDSDLFLASDQMGEVMMRIDDDPAEKTDALLHDKLALIDSPKKIDFAKDADKALSQFEAHVRFMQLREPHKRLRVRLTAFNGETADLDFDMTGNEPQIAALGKPVGFPIFVQVSNAWIRA